MVYRIAAGAAHITTKNSKRPPKPATSKLVTTPRIGWSITEPTEALCEFVIEQGWDDINMNRIESSYTPRGKGAGNATGKPTGGNSNPNSHSIKYVCPCCGNSVRATKAVNIMCMDCNEPMQP